MTAQQNKKTSPFNHPDDVLAALEQHRPHAPDDLVDRVMQALPERRQRWQDLVQLLWPERGQWLLPALSGAVAMFLLFAGVNTLRVVPPKSETVAVLFQVHAPEAERIEVVGSFNNWTSGQIVLEGPDVSGHWTATVELPEGRHEYLFLVDGRTWLTDPGATTHRPDGFGRLNAVLEL